MSYDMREFFKLSACPRKWCVPSCWVSVVEVMHLMLMEWWNSYSDF